MSDPIPPPGPPSEATGPAARSDAPGGSRARPKGGGYAEEALLAVLRAGRRPGTDMALAARAGGALVQALVEGQASEDIVGLLAPVPHSEARFEAVRQPPAPEHPVTVPKPPDVRTGVSLQEAMAEMAAVGEAIPQVEVFSLADGLRRKVLERRVGGPVVLVPLVVRAFEGDGDACRMATERWAAYLDHGQVPDLAGQVKEALADFAVEVDAKVFEEAVKRVLAGVVVEVDVQAIETAVRQAINETDDAIRAEVTSAIDTAVERATEDVIRQSDIPAIQGIVAEALGDVVRRSDLGGVEHAVKAAQADFSHRVHLIEEAGRTALGDLARKDDIATIAAAVREALAEVMAKVESTTGEAVRTTQASAVGRSELDAVIHAVRSLEDGVGNLQRSVGRALDSGLTAQVDADQIARTVVEQLEIPGPAASDPVGSSIVAQAALMSAGEQLQLQLEAFNDRIRAGSRSLEALADELAARERSASAFSEQLASSIDRSLARLGDRVDKRIAEATRPELDPALAAELRELARTLRTAVRSGQRTRSPRSAAS